jgi:hypothetical protein
MPARPSRSLGYGLAVVAGLGVVYYAAPLAVGLISLGAICPYSPAGTTICAGKEAAPATVTNLPPGLNTVLDAQQGEPLCSEAGIRYAGTTEDGAEVCFTLTPDRRQWAEIGFKVDGGRSCPDSAGAGTVAGRTYYLGPERLAGPRRISFSNFTGTITGTRAAGVLSDRHVCESRTFKWTARRRP